ncbi:MAG: 2'-5' RNA ligase family protein [Alphaproteobacteria bacterium]|nr:2'-5' RNA ligase family protein [Alphaproteobacteria bacterium]
MSLVILSRPVWAATDRAWLKALRDRHGGAYFDPSLGPHVTLVFPVEEVEESAAVSHLHAVVSDTPSFEAAFRAVLPVKDDFSSDTFLYLVPDEGLSGIVRLHDRLYSGPLADALRLDIPYIPHVTLGRFSSARIAKALADDLNAQDPVLATRVETVELFRLTDGSAPHRIAEFPLGG